MITDPADTIKSPIRYGEYQYDSETEYTDAQGNFVTGLHYLNARHYDPGTARFLEIDTYTGDISDPLSLNFYTYCRNEPIMYTDPTGYYTEDNLLSYERNLRYMRQFYEVYPNWNTVRSDLS